MTNGGSLIDLLPLIRQPMVICRGAGICWHLHSESSKACSTDIYVGRSVWSPRMAMNTLEQGTKGDVHTVVKAGLSPEKKRI
jgi:hypothetical protein